jgi:hypothetical protein
MEDQITRISAFIREHAHSSFCPPCISTNLGISEQNVRERLQVMVARPDLQQHFALKRCPCYGCGVIGPYVVMTRASSGDTVVS